MGERGKSLRAQLGALRPGELVLVSWAALYFYFLLAAYYVLRPMRDSFGAENPSELRWLFTGTFAATLIAQPLYGRLVARRGRASFIPIAYRVLAGTALAFGALLALLEDGALRWTHRLFFMWLSVFAVFTVTIFWSNLADLMGSRRAKRLYGLIAIGGTLGAATGALLAAGIEDLVAWFLRLAHGSSETVDATPYLPVIAALFLELAVRAARRVERVELARESDDPATDAGAPVGGSALDGFRDVVRSPYLIGICVYVAIFVVASSALYFVNSTVSGDVFESSTARRQFFAKVDLAVNGIALVLQLFATGAVLRRVGLGPALAVTPLVGLIGFAAVASSPTLVILATLFIARRGLEFGLSKPAREALFTVVSRDEKYKAKALIDTAIYRGGDVAMLWLIALVTAGGGGLAVISWSVVPLCAVGVVLSVALGREQARRSRA